MEMRRPSREDNALSKPLRILSLDGGGMRGYSMLIILQELMHRTFVETYSRAPSRQEIPKPCDHFDLIVGTGIGGLIALMLGRLRLDIETTKDIYIRLTRKVFETDKTIAGIPYGATLFKASRLEEAIRQCVRESKPQDESPGIDDCLDRGPFGPRSPSFDKGSARTFEYSHRSSTAGLIKISAQIPSSLIVTDFFSKSKSDSGGAELYDLHPARTKTAVVAFYKGSPPGSAPILLRSYDSRRESSFDSDCKIWQAGRATCAIEHAFKSIRIGESCFQDDGLSPFNPAPEALDEAMVNEWPGRQLGILVSVGAGKRIPGNSPRSPTWQDGSLPKEYSESRKKLISKVERCEDVHLYMEEEHIYKRGASPSSYVRLNAELSLGDELGIGELNQLREVSMDTRRYLAREKEQDLVHRVAFALAAGDDITPDCPPGLNITPPMCELDATSETQPSTLLELPGDTPCFRFELEAAPVTKPHKSVGEHKPLHRIPRKPPAGSSTIAPPSLKQQQQLSTSTPVSLVYSQVGMSSELRQKLPMAYVESRIDHAKGGAFCKTGSRHQLPLRTAESRIVEERPPPPPPK